MPYGRLQRQMTYKGRNQEQIERYRAHERAKARALRALAKAHPGEFAVLLERERAADDGGKKGRGE